MTLPRPIAAKLFDGVGERAPHEWRLLAARDRTTGKIRFPFPADASEDRHEPVALPTRGTLWSFTVQRFRPKSPPYAGPEEFEPYAVGYVELGDTIIVESRLAGIEFDDLRIGLPVELVIEPFTLADGSKPMGFAFTPIAASDLQ